MVDPVEVVEPELEDSGTLVEPEVPLETAFPGRLRVWVFASAWKAARERDALALVFSLITMVIPFWQCFPCEQYSHIGVVLLIIIVYVGVI